ncbi:MAG: tetratricopeptide repeat protein, partial [Candidatus Woesearchaeota archaeon]
MSDKKDIKNSISKSKFENVHGSINVGDGLNEEQVRQILEEEISKQSGHLKKEFNKENEFQTQQILKKIEEPKQNQNVEYDFKLLNKRYSREIDNIKEEIDNNEIDSALIRLLDLKENEWQNAEPEIKFRILTNIGVIYSNIDKTKEAARYFLKAYKILPDNPKAINNVAISFIYLNHLDNEIFQQLKQKAPNLHKSLDIRFNKKEQELEDIESNLKPEVFVDENSLMALADHAHFEKKPDKAILYCRKALEINNTTVFQENLANSILFKYINFPQLSFQYLKNYDGKIEIQEGIDLYERCWEEYKLGEMRKYKSEIKSKQSLLLSLLGRVQEAKDAIEIALQEKKDDEYFLKYKALILTSKGECPEAIDIFKDLDYATHPDAPISLAICYLKGGHAEKAIEVLEKFVNQSQNDQFKINAIAFLIDIYIKENKIEEAEKIFKKEPELVKNSNELLLSKSLVLKNKGQNEIATEILDDILHKSKIINDQRIKFFLAQTLEEHGRKEEAINYYLENIDITKYNEFTQKIINLYLDIDRKDKALQVLKDLRKHNGIIKDVSKNEVFLNLYKGDFREAREVAIEYLNIYSEDVDLAIDLAVINTKLGNNKDVRDFLDKEFDYLNLTIDRISIYLNLLAQNNYKKKAYDILYNVWNEKESAEYNDLLIHFNFRYPITKEIAEYSDIVKIDYSVRLKDENNDFLWYTLTN